jgi:hypothetical protein
MSISRARVKLRQYITYFEYTGYWRGYKGVAWKGAFYVFEKNQSE